MKWKKRRGCGVKLALHKLQCREMAAILAKN